MKKSFFTFTFTFLLMVLASSRPATADDLDIYSGALLNDPPVNVLFVFDISGSMGLRPDGTPATSLEGPDSRYGILLKALKDVLVANKNKAGLNVGVSWFNRYITGIQWPISPIGDDAHAIDNTIPAGDFKVYEIIPHIIENDSWVNPSYETKMVPALLDAANYFRGDPVWKLRAPKIWNAAAQDYQSGNNWSPNPMAYDPSPTALAATSHPPYHPSVPTTKSFARYLNVHTTRYSCNPIYQSWCHNGYNTQSTGYDPYSISDPGHVNVRSCADETVNYWSCPVPNTCTTSINAEGNTVTSCHCPVALVNNPVTRHKCTYDYWQSGPLGAIYKSPISSCSRNIIVLLSDGKPTKSENIPGIESLIGKSCTDIPGIPHGKCGPELVNFLANNDQIPGIPGSRVNTYTIGFNADPTGKSFLQMLATAGGGQYYEASNVASLTTVLSNIISSVTVEAETFTGLSTTTQASTVSSSPRVFLNLFKPLNKRSWPGNTKGYFASPQGLRDLDGDLAVEETGSKSVFKPTARSFWTLIPDGNSVNAGGVSEKLLSGGRTIYTYTGTTPPADSSLTKLNVGDSSLSPALFAVSDHASKDAIISWLDKSGMSDALHSKPLVLSFPGKDVMFTMTNQGLLHAVDVTDNVSGGNEIFAFIPQALLPQIKDHKANAGATGSNHLYGLDGSLSYWHDDTNGNHIIDSGEKVYLYFGMRRGGDHYYALDVTDLQAGRKPDLQWRIDGGTGKFKVLGQTWSRMVVTRVPWTNAKGYRSVLIFGGGYDTDQDSHTVRTVDDKGNAIYMVDVETGELLWSAQNSSAPGATIVAEMKYSIPSDVTVIDSNDNQLADRLYFGDMGGQIWRIDLDEAAFGSGTPSATVTRLALLSDSSSAGNRRFYYPPAVALIEKAGNYYYTVAIGSGWRAKPLSTVVENKFFMIRDANVTTGAPIGWTTKTVADLYNIDSNEIGQGSDPDQAMNDLINNYGGWQLSLSYPGEKALSQPLIFDHQLFFTTVTPASSALGCGSGTGRLYVMNLFDGVPVHDFVADSTMKAEDRSKNLPGHGIPGAPVPWFPAGKGSMEIYVGKDRALPSTAQELQRINWRVIK